MLHQYKIFLSELKKHQLKSGLNYFLRWQRSLKKGASSVRDEQPWITFKTIDYLKKHLQKTDKVLEYGGGGSTLFFVNRVEEVVTVEHNEEWFDILEQMMLKKACNNWKGFLVKAEKGDLVPNPDFSNPDHYSSDDAPSIGYNYKAYASTIDQFPNAYFNLVLVDGRSRPACIKHAVSKIRSGGYLILDNSDRAYYLKQTQSLLTNDFTRVFGEYAPSPYLKEFTHTTLWQKK